MKNKKNSRGYYIYKYVYNGEIVYIGKTVDIVKRIKQHASGKGLDAKFQQYRDAEIYYYACTSTIFMDALEGIFIDAIKPPLNVSSKTNVPAEMSLLPSIKWEIYNENDFEDESTELNRTSHKHHKKTPEEIQNDYRERIEKSRKKCWMIKYLIDEYMSPQELPFHIVVFNNKIDHETMHDISMQFLGIEIITNTRCSSMCIMDASQWVTTDKNNFLIVYHTDGFIFLNSMYDIISKFCNNEIEYDEFSNIADDILDFKNKRFPKSINPYHNALNSHNYMRRIEVVEHVIKNKEVKVLTADDIIRFTNEHIYDYYETIFGKAIDEYGKDRIKKFNSMIQRYKSITTLAKYPGF